MFVFCEWTILGWQKWGIVLENEMSENWIDQKMSTIIVHTNYSWNIKLQKCAGISGLWALNEINQKKNPESMKKNRGSRLEVTC